MILQKETPVSENDTLGTVYFDRLFPMGVAAMLEAADLVVAGKHREVVQDESQASYEGWFRAAEAQGELEPARRLDPQHHPRLPIPRRARGPRSAARSCSSSARGSTSCAPSAR